MYFLPKFGQKCFFFSLIQISPSTDLNFCGLIVFIDCPYLSSVTGLTVLFTSLPSLCNGHVQGSAREDSG